MIGELTHLAATRFSCETALITSGRSLSFLDVDRDVSAFAGGLRSLGVGRGDRVVLHLLNGWRWVVAYYAIARLGAVVVPANILLTAAEVAFMAEDAGAAVVARWAALSRMVNRRRALSRTMRRMPLGQSWRAGAFTDVLAPSPPCAMSTSVCSKSETLRRWPCNGRR